MNAAIRRSTKGSRSYIASSRERASPCWASPATTSAARSRAPRRKLPTFCRLTYDVTFPMFAKVSTVAGPSQSPIYKFLGATGQPARVEFQQVRRRQGWQGRRVLPERGHTGGAGASQRDREGAWISVMRRRLLLGGARGGSAPRLSPPMKGCGDSISCRPAP